MGSVKRRVEELERKTAGEEKVRIFVDWSMEGEEVPEPEPNVTVITWDDEDEEGLDDD